MTPERKAAALAAIERGKELLTITSQLQTAFGRLDSFPHLVQKVTELVELLTEALAENEKSDKYVEAVVARQAKLSRVLKQKEEALVEALKENKRLEERVRDLNLVIGHENRDDFFVPEVEK